MTAAAPGRPGLRRPLLLLLALAFLIALSFAFRLDERLAAVRDRIAGLGAWGPVVYGLIYVAAVVAAVPGSALTLAAGALFGSAVGIVLVSLASTAGACLAFLLARYLARDWVAARLSGRESFRRLDRLTRERGAVIVALVRLIPLFPFNLVNYGFGLTSVPFGTYAFWSWLCMLPADVVYITGADALARGVTRKEVPWTVLGVMALASLLLWVLVRAARRKLAGAAGGEPRGRAPDDASGNRPLS